MSGASESTRDRSGRMHVAGVTAREARENAPDAGATIHDGGAALRRTADVERSTRDASLDVSGWASEVFASIQGEGACVGEPQVFLRTAGCVETCRWCDTLYAKVRAARFVVRTPAGVRAHANPVPARVAVDEAVALARGAGIRTVSLTGGEPLEQSAFAGACASALRREGLRVHLETAGIHAEAFARVRPFVDVVAMDIKLPSATGRDAWHEHERFLDAAAGRGAPELFVKIVVDADATDDEIARAARLVAYAQPDALLVLQPESGTLLSGGEAADSLLRHVERLAEVARACHGRVRVIPQCHRIVGVR